jgi:uncharacterized protein (DUF58 family)
VEPPTMLFSKSFNPWKYHADMSGLRQIFFAFFLGRWFYRLLAGIIFLFVLSFGIPILFEVAQLLLFLLALSLVLDFILLFVEKNKLTARRIIPERFSNGEENLIQWELKNNYPFQLSLFLIDEFPENWQIRDFRLKAIIAAGENNTLGYIVRPGERGMFSFGKFYVFFRSPLRLVKRRKAFAENTRIHVYPGFLKLRQLEFMAHISDPGNIGFKQVRKTGHSLEFEQIREYVPGDDIRSINWKATGRTGGQLMINNYTDEKSQQIYCIIDKGRTMKMPFEGLTLLDYAVNATLAMSSVAISRQDKSGFISFGDRGGDFLPANHRSAQMAAIVQMLYNLRTQFLESDFSFLYNLIKTRITQRSLLILFTNFESVSSLRRQLPYLRNIAQKHLLLVVFFENTSLKQLASSEVDSVDRLYEKVIAEKFVLEKKLIVKELQRYGIAALLTEPEKLTVDIINKYLQVKARREI